MIEPNVDLDLAQPLLQRSRELLERSAQEFDGATLSRLTRARHAALDRGLAAPRRGISVLGWFGATAVSAGLVLVLWQALGTPTPGPAIQPLADAPAPPVVAPREAPVAAPDFELLADADSYALLEDLEFYAWLEAEEGNGG